MQAVILHACFLLLAAETEEAESWIIEEPKTEETPAPNDDVEILYRADFEEGQDGWKNEEWEQYKPWNEVELTSENTFQESKQSLKTTVPNTWNCLGPVRDFNFKENGTKVSFAYYGHHCNSVNVQCWNVEHDVNMHFTHNPYRDGEWDTGTAEVAKFVTWGGTSPPAAGKTFRTLMVYAGCNKTYSDHYFLIDGIVVYNGTDRTPPPKPEWLGGRVDWKEGNVVVSWKVPEDNVGVARFHVYRSTQPDIVPSAKNRVGSTTGVELADGTISNLGVFFYRVVAEDFAGNRSKPSAALAVRVVEKEQ